MINVLFLTSENGKPLGSARSLSYLIRSLSESINPIVIVRGDKGKPFFESMGIKTISLKYPVDITEKTGIEFFLNFIPRCIRDFVLKRRVLRELQKICRNYNIDIIHSNNSIIDIGYYLAKKEHLPHVWHIREFIDLDFHWKPFFGWHNLREKIQSADARIFVSKTLRKHFGFNNSANSYQIYNAVRSIKDLRFDCNKEKFFLMCGHISSTKGIETGIKAFAEFSKYNKEFRLKLVGNVEPLYKSELLNLASRLNVKDKIDFEGYQSDPKRYYEKAVAYLMCSKHEAMGRVTVEAMFYGCPVIGYDGGGTAEIVENNVTGYLFKTVSECVQCMNKVMSYGRINEIIFKAQEKARKDFSIESYGKKILGIYKDILKRN